MFLFLELFLPLVQIVFLSLDISFEDFELLLIFNFFGFLVIDLLVFVPPGQTKFLHFSVFQNLLVLPEVLPVLDLALLHLYFRQQVVVDPQADLLEQRRLLLDVSLG